jgi:hypothetical protein
MLVIEDEMIESQERKVLHAYQIFKQKMAQCGKMISFPKNTDPRKTYSWRYVLNFVKKFDENELPNESMTMVIGAIIKHANERGMIDRGFAILGHGDLLSIIHQKLAHDVNEEHDILMLVSKSHEFLTQQDKGALTNYSTRNGFANITRWYESGHLDINHIAISKICRRSLNAIKSHERGLFPDTKSLYKLRLKLINSPLLGKLREILGDDLFEE